MQLTENRAQLAGELCADRGARPGVRPEILESSYFIINRYRAARSRWIYRVDNFLNSVSDIAAMAAGFFLARGRSGC
jgi:hypothetical protein